MRCATTRNGSNPPPHSKRQHERRAIRPSADLATYTAAADLFPFISQLTSRDARRHAAHLLPSPDCDDPYYGDPRYRQRYQRRRTENLVVFGLGMHLPAEQLAVSAYVQWRFMRWAKSKQEGGETASDLTREGRHFRVPVAIEPRTWVQCYIETKLSSGKATTATSLVLSHRTRAGTQSGRSPWQKSARLADRQAPLIVCSDASSTASRSVPTT